MKIEDAVEKLAEYKNLGTVEEFENYKTNSLSKIEFYKGGDAERDLSNELKAVAEKLEQLEKDSIAINKINNVVKQNLSKELEVYKKALELLSVRNSELAREYYIGKEDYNTYMKNNPIRTIKMYLDKARKELKEV